MTKSGGDQVWTVIAVHWGHECVDAYSMHFDAALPAIASAIAGNVESRGTIVSYEVVPPSSPARRVGGLGLYRLAEEEGIGQAELDAAVAAKLAW